MFNYTLISCFQFSSYFLIGCAGCALMTTTSICLAIFFNYKVLLFLRQDNVQKEQKVAFRGIQKTMIIQLISHFIFLSCTLIGLVTFSFFGIPYLLPFTAMMECGPTVTTILTLISVPEYRRKIRLCFRKVTRL